jgi:hypothetical protein
MIQTLKTYIKEQKNTHMEHVEDEIFNNGVEGTRKAINFLRDLRDMLAGHSKSKIVSTVKWDGAPAIFAGIDPTDNKFFIAKKGVFNKNPKVYKTNADIDADTSVDLNAKFKVALSEFKKLGIKSGVYQGDLMFTNDTKIETIDGQKYITFHPNTIVYAIPADTPLAKKIQSAKIGVVWHTIYEGNTFETMSASFGQSIVSKFNSVSSIWMCDATYQNVSGTATFTKAETDEITSTLSEIGRIFQSVPADVINNIRDNERLKALVKEYNNSIIKAGKTITNTKSHTTGLFHYIHDKFQSEIDKLKSEKGKTSKTQERDEVLTYFTKHSQSDIAKVFDLMNMLANAKQVIINKMNLAGHIPTFLKTKNGFRVTNVEGFVAIDELTGGAVKLVDRMEFSYANFSPDVIKGWQR